VPRVAWAGVPPFRGGVFWQKISEVVLFDITLAQVVLCVKNSTDCSAIQPGGACYKKNDLAALASFAYNHYYQKNANTGATYSNGTASLPPLPPPIQVSIHFD
jgi:hypothetical protein